MKKLSVLLVVLMVVGSLCFAQGGTESTQSSKNEEVTLEFMQWWEPEMTAGSLAKVVSDFEVANPGIKIKLISKPYNDVQNQVTIAAASGTLSDIMGLDPKWAYDLAKQKAVLPLDDLITKNKYDVSKIDATKVDGKTYVLTFEGFIYPLFYNVDMFKEAGISKAPETWSEFLVDAKKLNDPSKDRSALAWGISMQTPSAVQNDIYSWVWAMDGTLYPRIDLPENVETIQFLADVYKAGLISPGALVGAEQDKVELFTNGRAAMMVDSLAHLNLINERNPNLHFDIAPVPVKDGYTGKKAFRGAGWGIGISATTKHPEEAWKFIQYVMSSEINGYVADNCNAFPINKDASVNWVNSNDLNKKAFNLYQKMGMKNESWGAPKANQLCGAFDEQFQEVLNGRQTVQDCLKKTQVEFDKVYAEAAK